ncbi:hypothetical protein DEU52_105217 [Ensifer adhaerens]|nr:hypothetical protein DEU52_105217 [Ensifer adhaerens]
MLQLDLHLVLKNQNLMAHFVFRTSAGKELIR